MGERVSSEKDIVRLSVVVDDALAEHVRWRAFETRQSKSAYVRQLISDDAKARKRDAGRQVGG